MRNCMLLLLFYLFFSNGYAQEGCHLKKDSEAIKVFLCETEESAFKTIKVQLEAETTLKEYAAGLLDIESYKYWQYNILDPHILKVINKKEVIYYSEVDTPWPISHRDLVFHLKMWQDSTSQVLYVSLEQLPDYIPEKEGIVRIPEAKSLLSVTPINENRVSVSYIIHVDPGGEVPAFIANLFSAQTPWQTFKNYRDRLKAIRNDTSSIPFIRNYTKLK